LSPYTTLFRSDFNAAFDQAASHFRYIRNSNTEVWKVFGYPGIRTHQPPINGTATDRNQGSQFCGGKKILFFDLQMVFGNKIIATTILVIVEKKDALVDRNQHACYPESARHGDDEEVEVAAFIHVAFRKTSGSHHSADEGESADEPSTPVRQGCHTMRQDVSAKATLCGMFVGAQAVQVGEPVHEIGRASCRERG